MRAMKKWLASLMALALLAGVLPAAALAAETTIYLDGYQHQSGEGGEPKVYEVKEGGQLSLKGDLTRTGVVESREFEDAADIFEIPVYTAKGSVEVTLTDGYVPGEPMDGTDEDGDIWVRFALATAGIDTAAYDAAKKSAETIKENALYFDGKITYVEAGSEKEKTVSLQEFFGDPDIWDKVGAPPSIHKGAKAVLTEPGTYRVSAYYEALAGGCVAYVIIPETETTDTTAVPEEKVEEGKTTPAAPQFTDVSAASPYAAAITWAVGREITLGKTETTFGPGDPCTVSHILTFLWRANGKPGAEESVADRTSAAKWAVEKEMIAEDADLAAACTRGMAVTFMWKAAGSPEVETEKEFTDVAAGAEYAGAVAWAVENEITAGTGDGTTFAPGSPCNRGQIVTFLFRQLAEKETKPAA